jgi:hypothetical protein
VYPAEELLQEVGRVTIAGSRLEIQLGRLWWHLDKDNVTEETTRKLGIDKQARAIRTLAHTNLWGDLQSAVIEAVETAQNAADRRNNIVHQDWVLRGRDAMRPVADMPDFTSYRELSRYVDQWERETRDSPDWLRQPSKSFDLVRAQTLPELVKVERALAAATDRVTGLVFAVASARDTGRPAGWGAVAPDESTDPPDEA